MKPVLQREDFALSRVRRSPTATRRRIGNGRDVPQASSPEFPNASRERGRSASRALVAPIHLKCRDHAISHFQGDHTDEGRRGSQVDRELIRRRENRHDRLWAAIDHALPCPEPQPRLGMPLSKVCKLASGSPKNSVRILRDMRGHDAPPPQSESFLSSQSDW